MEEEAKTLSREIAQQIKADAMYCFGQGREGTCLVESFDDLVDEIQKVIAEAAADLPKAADHPTAQGWYEDFWSRWYPKWVGDKK